jgi:hypothetical protein
LPQLAVSVGTAALADIDAAVGSASAAGIDLVSLRTAMGVTDMATPGTAAFSAAQANLADAQISLQASLGASDVAILQIDQVTTATAPLAREGLTAAIDASHRLSSLVEARTSVRRAATNLANASS